MKKIRIGLVLAALLTGVVVFSAFTNRDKATAKHGTGTATDPLYFRFTGSTHTPGDLTDPLKWIFEGNVNPGTGCAGGNIVCRVELEPVDNPGITEEEDNEIAAMLFAEYLESHDGSDEYESAEDFVLRNFVSKKP